MLPAIPTTVPPQHEYAIVSGAECWRCPLLGCGRGPVHPTIPDQMHVLVVAEAPGHTEVEQGRTLVGASGKEIRKALTDAGADMSRVGYTNALLCLDGNAMIRFADGSIKSIRSVVQDRDDRPVLTLQPDGMLAAAPITGWHRNSRAGREMRHLYFKTARLAPTQGVSSIRLTSDHPVRTRHGWVPARDVAGEEIATGQRALQGSGLSVVLGTLLGDAQIKRSRLSFSHAIDQEQYARFKQRAISPLLTSHRIQPPQRNNVQHQIVVNTRASRWLTFVEQAFYPEGKKRLGVEARRLLESEFSALLAAVWFCDDGYTNIRHGRQPLSEFATCCFTVDDVSFLQKMLLEKMGVESYTRDNRGPRIVLGADATTVFLRSIASYVPPDLQYKLPENLRGHFDAAAYTPSSAVTFWDKAVCTPVEARSDIVFCIDVAETHNFVTTGGVVHNCQPEGDLKNYLRAVKKEGHPSPIDCCAPRVQREMQQAKFAILMGGASLQAVGISGSILQLRGTPVQIPDGGPLAVPIPHAAFVMRDEGATLRPIFHADVKKAIRLSRGGNTWVEPQFFVARSAVEIDNFLSVARPFLAVDTETDGIDPWTCGLRRIGIGTAQEVLIYAPLSVRGHQLLDADTIQACTRAFAAFFQQQRSLVFHNYWGFDSIVLNQHRMPVRDENVFDSFVAHSVGVTSELPHRLDFLGSMYTDAPFWKNDVKHSNVHDDRVLDKYLSFDVAITHAATPYVSQNLQATQQEHVYRTDTEMWRAGRSMAALGIRIDRDLQFKFASEYQEKADRLTREFVETAGRAVNPNSVPQVKKLLYEDLGLPILEEHTTGTGEASTDEQTLLDLLGLGVDKRAEKIIHALIGVREAEKVLGTSTGRIENGVLVGGPPLHADGRLRTTWRPGKVTGRWGSSQPVNMMNVQKKLRAMYRPAPGNKFVAADMSAVELRVLALLSGDQPMIEAFAAFDAGTGPDVHTINACSIFRCTKEQVTDEIRTFCKRVIFGAAYGAQAPKIYQTLSLMRDDNLKPLFAHITLPEVERVLNTWWGQHPAISEWQKKLIHSRRSCGYIASPWHKRRRYFIGGENQQEEVNYPIQGGAADLQNSAVGALMPAFPFDYVNHRGLVLQVHDQLVVECHESEVERVKQIVEWCMTKKIDGMLFPAIAKVGDDWKSVS